jgi:hypothetical protein
MGQAPAMQSFPLMSGDQQQFEFTVRDNDDAVVDVTGGSGRFAMARTERDTPVIDSDASPATATVSIIDAVTGRVNVVITDENTEALIGDYYYELKWTDASGREAVVARGWASFAVNLT